MDGQLAYRVCEKALDEVKSFIPNFSKHSLNKSFNELWVNDEKFAQIRLIDKTDISNRYNSNEVTILISPKDIDVFQKEVDKYNEELTKVLHEIVQQDILEFEHHTFYYFNRVKTDLGICHMYIHIRNRSKEELQEQKDMLKHKMLMETDEDYRKEHEWFQAKNRPFGGAFESDEEYYQYRGAL